MDWDKTTYRISRIPESYGKHDLSSALITILGLNDSAGVKIHSLASDASGQGVLRSQTATVSFYDRPKLLEKDFTDLGL